MRVVAVIEKDELAQLLRAMTPLKIVIDQKRGRTVTIGRPQLFELVAGRGLRIQSDARIVWDVAGMRVPVSVPTWRVLLTPRIAKSSMLVFDPEVEALDLKHAPSFLDDRIANAIRDAIAENRDRLAWGFARTLSRRVMLPARVGGGALDIAVTDGGVSVSEQELRIAFRVEPRVADKRSEIDAPPPSFQAAS